MPKRKSRKQLIFNINRIVSSMSDNVDDIKQSVNHIECKSSNQNTDCTKGSGLSNVNNDHNKSKHKSKAPKWLVTIDCLLGWWLLLFCISYIGNKVVSSFISAFLTSALFIFPLFYACKVKKFVIKITVLWGIILLVCILFALGLLLLIKLKIY